MIETAIIGAGPYGLSIAAHFRHRGIPFRIFGRPMDSWLAHMPKGMMLKSDGFASNIYDPDGKFTLRHFCAERGIEYADMGIPVGLATFGDYGLAFRDRMVPELEDKSRCQHRTLGGRIPVAIGRLVKKSRFGGWCSRSGSRILRTYPENLTHLPAEFLSHSYRHHDLSAFQGPQRGRVGRRLFGDGYGWITA